MRRHVPAARLQRPPRGPLEPHPALRHALRIQKQPGPVPNRRQVVRAMRLEQQRDVSLRQRSIQVLHPAQVPRLEMPRLHIRVVVKRPGFGAGFLTRVGRSDHGTEVSKGVA